MQQFLPCIFKALMKALHIPCRVYALYIYRIGCMISVNSNLPAFTRSELCSSEPPIQCLRDSRSWFHSGFQLTLHIWNSFLTPSFLDCSHIGIIRPAYDLLSPLFEAIYASLTLASHSHSTYYSVRYQSGNMHMAIFLLKTLFFFWGAVFSSSAGLKIIL